MTKTAVEKLNAKTAKLFYINASSGDRLWGSNGLYLKKGVKKCSFMVKFTSNAGRKREIVVGYYPDMTLSEAENKAIKIKAERLDGVDPVQVRNDLKVAAVREEQLTVGAYLVGRYSYYLESKKDGQGTVLRITKHFKGFLGKQMNALTSLDVELWQRQMMKGQITGKVLRFNTCNRSYMALKAMVNHAVKHKVIGVNPIADVSLLKSLNETPNGIELNRRLLNQEEVGQLLSGLDLCEAKLLKRSGGDMHWIRPFTMVLLTMGFRIGDVYTLKWNEIDLDFSQTVKKVISKTESSSSGLRSFPMCNELVEVLRHWKECTGGGNGYVFSSPQDISKTLSHVSYNAHWNNIKLLGGLDIRLHAYTMRHHFASTLVMQGVDLLTVSRLMAHASITTTIKHYGHLAPERARDSIQGFADGLFTQGVTTPVHKAV